MNASATACPPTSTFSASGRNGSVIGFTLLGPIAAAAVCFPFAVLAVVAPKFAEIFRDFGVALPAASRVQIRIGVALASPQGVAVLVLAAIVIALVVGFAWRVHRAIGLFLVSLACAWFALTIGIVVVGMMLPLEAMIQSLERGGAA